MWRRYVKKISVLLYLTEGYESMWNKIDHPCLIQNFFTDRCSEIILATAKNEFRIVCIEVTICPVCRWCIFRSSLSFTDFIPSISGRLTSVPKFHKCFLLSRFKAFVWAQTASISYHLITALKNDVFISSIKEVIK